MPNAKAPPTAPKVSVLTIAPRPVTLSTELAGRTTPYIVAEVRPQVRGIVKERLFEEGARVKAGQSLYRIDSATYEADLESAKAGLAKAEANLATLRLKAQRFDELVGINAVSRQARDDATAAFLEQVVERWSASRVRQMAGADAEACFNVLAELSALVLEAGLRCPERTVARGTFDETRQAFRERLLERSAAQPLAGDERDRWVTSLSDRASLLLRSTRRPKAMPAPYTQVPGPRADGGAASVLRLNTLTIFSAFSGSSIEACSSAGETFIG